MTASADPDADNLDRVMQRSLNEMRQLFEPYAVDHASTENVPLMSIAISLRRLADQGDVTRMAMAGVNDFCFKAGPALDQIKASGTAVVVGLDQIKQAINSLEYETRQSNEKGIEVVVSKG